MSPASSDRYPNSLVCFTNCKLALEDGSIVQRDLWIDEERGIILDAQKTFFEGGQRPDTIIDLEGDILSPGFIDAQINGAYGFDFSLFHNEDPTAYDSGLRMVARRIVETGVTSLLPTMITQRRDLYPKLLPLLAPASHPESATLLGWHAEGPFLQPAKRGAHMPSFLLSAPEGITTFEDVYGTSALRKDFLGVRVITVAPELDGVVPAIQELTKRGVIFSIGHSIASSTTAGEGVLAGARLITHLFNAMPQLHHRDPSIIGLLGASDSTASFAFSNPADTHSNSKSQFTYSGQDSKKAGQATAEGKNGGGSVRSQMAEALVETATPPQTPGLPDRQFTFTSSDKVRATGSMQSVASSKDRTDATVASDDTEEPATTTMPFTDIPPLAIAPLPTLPPIENLIRGEDETVTRQHLEREFETQSRKLERPFYGLIVDGCHSHPHSVRLAYTAHPEGCILVTDAMPMLDPHLKDGIHAWRDGKRLIKEGVKLYIEGTDTLAGSVVTLDICVRNFAKFTGCGLGKAIRCATYNPAACLKIENRKGTLRAGADADLVLLDSAGYVKGTWVSGRKVWPTENRRGREGNTLSPALDSAIRESATLN